MRIGSLFSGIGGLERGLEASIPGAHTVWQVEQNEYARAVLAKHWPEAKRYDDVREVGAHNLEPVDLICGGFPCQDISLAGKQAGIDGARSGLWSEYARIIGDLRPRYVAVENVSALLTGGMGRVLGDLATLGYDAVWDCIPAASVGAPHRRDRVFLVAYSNSSTLYAEQVKGQECKTPPKLIRNGQAWKMARRKARPWPDQPSVCRVANGIPRRVDRLRCLGNAVVPQVAEVVGRVIMEIDNADL